MTDKTDDVSFQIPMATTQKQKPPHTSQIKAQTFGVILIIGTHWQCAFGDYFWFDTKLWYTCKTLPTANAIGSTNEPPKGG